LRSILALALLLFAVGAQASVTVGSKKFTESFVLGEIAQAALREAGLQVQHKQGMGATAIVWAALTGGGIDAYPEYTGTLAEEILKKPGLALEEIRRELEPRGIGVTDELGFNNTYALVMKREQAEKLGIESISDLRNHPNLRAGPTHEFLERSDGWRPLMAKYGVQLRQVRGIEHALGYAALNSGEIDIKDSYSTDAEIAKYDLRVLRDDQSFFPEYKAVFVYRLDAPEQAKETLRAMAGTIDEPLMIRMNARADETTNYAEAATVYFESLGVDAAPVRQEPVSRRLARLIGQHLLLVFLSLSLAVLVAVPLGIIGSKGGASGGAILGVVGVIQTIPSLALLALLVPLLGIGAGTAVFALFLYSLLPIVRNTASGIANIPPPLRESARALGLEPIARLRKIYLPLAMPMIIAGIKTSAVINVGTATIAALIGAGGLGEPIISGLALNDDRTILMGAIPAALLAIAVQVGFDLVERMVVPRGLRVGSGRQ
jgi:osmoprotectant transport system permease protein